MSFGMAMWNRPTLSELSQSGDRAKREIRTTPMNAGKMRQRYVRATVEFISSPFFRIDWKKFVFSVREKNNIRRVNRQKVDEGDVGSKTTYLIRKNEPGEILCQDKF